MSVTPISNRRHDGLSEWLLKHGFALTRRWCELNCDKATDEIDALVEGRSNGEKLAQIPRYLCGKDEDGNPISRRKAKVISIRPRCQR